MALSDLVWTDWRPISLADPPSPTVLAELLDGGQTFRWTQVAHDTWQGIWSDCVARVRALPEAVLLWSAPAGIADRVAGQLPDYLGAATPLAEWTDRLPWRSDFHLRRCLEAFRGLRLLRQPLGETLLSFLCSTNKQIVQIRQMSALLAHRHGREIVPGISRLPTWTELASASEVDLRACRLGFRAGYIRQTAEFLARRSGWLDETARLPYAEARLRLCELPGVGEKVADCVLLFGAGRLEAFPVDIWITKAMVNHYGLRGWTTAQIAQFGRMHFGAQAGLAQQYLFAWERAHGRAAEVPPLAGSA